jgi:hypothetical protein
LGYVDRGRHDIAIGALPPRIGLTKAMRMGHTPEQFGAIAGRKWPRLAVRRFLLYGVFLHELGHLQTAEGARSARLKFAREPLAQEFAVEWCGRLWSATYAHSDPVHNPPGSCELAAAIGELELAG